MHECLCAECQHRAKTRGTNGPSRTITQRLFEEFHEDVCRRYSRQQTRYKCCHIVRTSDSGINLYLFFSSLCVRASICELLELGDVWGLGLYKYSTLASKHSHDKSNVQSYKKGRRLSIEQEIKFTFVAIFSRQERLRNDAICEQPCLCNASCCSTKECPRLIMSSPCDNMNLLFYFAMPEFCILSRDSDRNLNRLPEFEFSNHS